MQERQTLSDAELLALVRVVATHVSDEQPTTVSKRAFDDGRAPARALRCPTASNLCRHFASSWPALLELAFRGESVVRTSASRRRAKSAHEGEGVSRETAITALAIIAARLGRRTLRPDDYQAAREELLAKARRAHREALERRLPTVGQVSWFGPWDDLLELAGLEHRANDTNQIRSVPVEDAVERFLIAQGYLPGRKEMQRFARECGFSLQKATSQEYADVHERLRQRRAEHGLWTPAGQPRRHMKPPWTAMTDDEQAELPAPAPNNYWTLERVTDGLRHALTKLTPGQDLTQARLRNLAKTDRAIPAASTVTDVAKAHGTTFSALRDQVVSEFE